MRLVEVKLTNFRCYALETTVRLDPLTVIIGRNDAGKSSILDALDVFFNDSSIDLEDCNKGTNSKEVRIACVFDDLPASIVLDRTHPTTLAAEFLTRPDGKLELTKSFRLSGQRKSANAKKYDSVSVLALHPSAQGVGDLLGLKKSDLKERALARGVDLTGTNESIKAQLRHAIRCATPDLALASREVELTGEGGEEVWKLLEEALPVYALFKSDRTSTDQDSEAQDPMKSAVKDVFKKHDAKLKEITDQVEAELQDLADQTVSKLREMSPELATGLKPMAKREKGWDTIFKISLTGEEEIPINKRGSGTRRLVLLNFFRAKAEETSEKKGAGIIYAIEEPETSQHPNHQVMLLLAFEELAERGGHQILLTTHTPTLARRVDRNSLRLVTKEPTGPTIHYGALDATLCIIKETLGVLADHDVKVFLGVEGKHDIEFLKRISGILAAVEADIPDLSVAEANGHLIFVPLGGSSLELWTSRLANLGRPEFYLTDRDHQPPAQPKYHQSIQDWTARGCTAWATSKKELENYLEPSVIVAEAPGYTGTGGDFEDVPMLFAEALHNAAIPAAAPWAGLPSDKKKDKAGAGKRRLNTSCVSRMTPALLTQIDPNHDVRTWLRSVGRALTP